MTWRALSRQLRQMIAISVQPQQAGRDRSPAWRQRQPVVVAPEANLGTGANTTVHPWCEQYMLELTVAS
jgi:hypothetical protein